MTAADFRRHWLTSRPGRVQAIVEAAEQTPGHEALRAEVQRLLRERGA